jgi:uncharacterized protein (TIGR02453 family)
MPSTPDLRPILSFLGDLRQNNNKAWFDEHRPAYEKARLTFYQLVDDLIDEFRASDQLQDLSAKDCVARIYRDLRFTKDKSPYKTNLGAVIAPGGWKSSKNGYYVSIEPQDHSMAAGGLHDPTPEQLNRFRQSIDRDTAVFHEITDAADFVKAFGAVEGEQLKTAPKGYDPAHADIALLRLKQVLVIHRFSDEEILASDFEERVIVVCRAMKPFLDYLDGVFQ